MPVCYACNTDFRGPFCPACGATPSVPARSVAQTPTATEVERPRRVHAGGRSPVSVPGPASTAGGNGASAIEGTVVRIDPAVRTPGRRDGWKAATFFLLILGLLPLAIAFWIVSLALRLALGILGLGSHRRGNGLLSEIFAFHLVGAAMRPGEPIATYFYVVATDRGQVVVRQDDELAAGRMFVGHRVRLNGSWRAGTFLMRDGINETLGSSLAVRRSPWRLALPAALLVVVVEYLVLLSAVGGLQ